MSKTAQQSYKRPVYKVPYYNEKRDEILNSEVYEDIRKPVKTEETPIGILDSDEKAIITTLMYFQDLFFDIKRDWEKINGSLLGTADDVSYYHTTLDAIDSALYAADNELDHHIRLRIRNSLREDGTDITEMAGLKNVDPAKIDFKPRTGFKIVAICKGGNCPVPVTERIFKAIFSL